MDLKEIAAVSGKSGLFKVVKPTRNGVILEAIDETKKRFIAGAHDRVSILKEISIYTTGAENSIALEDVLVKLDTGFGPELPVNAKGSDDELRTFMAKLLPEYDKEKVYCSDIRKLVLWYNILKSNFPELLVAKPAEEPKIEEKKEEVKSTAESKKEAKKEKAEPKEKEEKTPKAKTSTAKAKK